jgi:hypothetical protein
MIGWEYLLVALPAFEAAKAAPGHSTAVDILNREGAAGWEAVGMSTLDDGSVAVLLKRRTPADDDASRGPSGATAQQPRPAT